MAIIAPFKGILYNQEIVPALEDVLTPPYDVISEQERDAYYERHPNNVIRLVLNRPEPDDQNGSNRYTRAAGFYQDWLKKGVLKQDAKPALYLTEMDYVSEGVARTRLGFVARVRLEDFDQGGILPHEKTFSATKVDRLHLMRATRAHFCPIFSIFSDPAGDAMAPLNTWAKEHAPDLAFEESAGFRHRLWRVVDPAVCEQVKETLKDRPFYIADGHHRYETGLNYRNEMLAQNKDLGPEASCHYVLMYLCSMQDPGLALRPVHRLISHVSKEALEGFAEKAGAYFEVETLSSSADGARKTFLQKIWGEEVRTVMGVVIRGQQTLFVLRLKEGVMERLFADTIPGPLRKLDVTVVTKLVVEKILGLDRTELDDPKRVIYTSRTSKAFDALERGVCDVALIMNPTRLRHVEEISDAGLIMPRKSTYFFPKALSGLVMNTFD